MRHCLQCGASTDGLFCPADGMATVVRDRKPLSPSLTINTVFAGRYRIVGVLGRGGMGAVYDARHTGTGQAVAIKTLLLDADEELQAVQRFFLEAKRTASLQHPNTIRVFDFGQNDDGVFYLAMERLSGETLAERLQRLAADGRTMRTSEAAAIAVDVLRSLAEAHRIGLVHRDLKPANIFLHDIGEGDPVVKVLDFGIAKQGSAQLTQGNMSLGTPAYMSPEQVTGEALDGRSDLYALGIVLFQCVTGQLPFAGESAYTVMMKHVHEPPPSLGLGNGASPAFAAVVRRALAKAPAERFDAANTMREALEPLIAADVTAPGATPAPLASEPAPPAREPVAPVAGLAASSGSEPAPTAGEPQQADASRRAVWLGAAVLLTAGAGGLWWAAATRPEAPASALAAPDGPLTRAETVAAPTAAAMAAGGQAGSAAAATPQPEAPAVAPTGAVAPTDAVAAAGAVILAGGVPPAAAAPPEAAATLPREASATKEAAVKAAPAAAAPDTQTAAAKPRKQAPRREGVRPPAAARPGTTARPQALVRPGPASVRPAQTVRPPRTSEPVRPPPSAPKPTVRPSVRPR